MERWNCGQQIKAVQKLRYSESDMINFDQTLASSPNSLLSGSAASTLLFGVFSILAAVFVVTVLLPIIVVSSFSTTTQAQSVPPHAGVLRGSQGGFYCDSGYHLVSYHMNLGSSNNAFYFQCNSDY